MAGKKKKNASQRPAVQLETKCAGGQTFSPRPRYCFYFSPFCNLHFVSPINKFELFFFVCLFVFFFVILNTDEAGTFNQQRARGIMFIRQPASQRSCRSGCLLQYVWLLIKETVIDRGGKLTHCPCSSAARCNFLVEPKEN